MITEYGKKYRIDELEVDTYKVYIGKDAESNDYVSLRLAKANDYWFHLKGMPSAHIVLCCHNERPSKSTIKKIAALTAYHSKQKSAGKVAVIYTMAKFVKKGRGAKAGSVNVSKETVIMVTAENIESS